MTVPVIPSVKFVKMPQKLLYRFRPRSSILERVNIICAISDISIFRGIGPEFLIFAPCFHLVCNTGFFCTICPLKPSCFGSRNRPAGLAFFIFLYPFVIWKNNKPAVSLPITIIDYIAWASFPLVYLLFDKHIFYFSSCACVQDFNQSRG